MTNTPESSSEDTRQRIITAALRLFERNGYAQTPTRAIADAAGVNEVTLFRHFGNKKNLLMACVETFNASGFAANFERELTGDYAADILSMVRLQIRSTAENLGFLRLLLCDARNVPELREAMLAGGSSNMARLAAFFQRQIDQGVVRSDCDPALLAVSFDSLFSSNLIFENIFLDSPEPRLPSEETIRSLAALFVRGTRAV